MFFLLQNVYKAQQENAQKEFDRRERERLSFKATTTTKTAAI